MAAVGLVPDRETDEGLQTRARLLLDEIDSMDLTPEKSMPVGGTAHYDGVIGFDGVSDRADFILPGAFMTADLDLDVNFGTNSMTGTASEFRSESDDIEVDGNLGLSGDITGASFSGTLSGQFSQTWYAGTVDIDLDGDFEGSFYGSDAGSLVAAGIAEGSQDGTPTSDYGLAFVAVAE